MLPFFYEVMPVANFDFQVSNFAFSVVVRYIDKNCRVQPSLVNVRAVSGPGFRPGSMRESQRQHPRVCSSASSNFLCLPLFLALLTSDRGAA
jgi:hypothetical protein